MAPELALRVGAAFGGGMARTAQTCGCVTGALMAIGLDQSSVSPEENQAARELTYEVAQRFLAEFRERHGSTVCLGLLGCDISTPEGKQQAREQRLFESRCGPLVRGGAELAAQLSDAAAAKG